MSSRGFPSPEEILETRGVSFSIAKNLLEDYLAGGRKLLELARELRKMVHGNRVTFSKNVFLPLTKICRNDCWYCGFKDRSGRLSLMEIEEIELMLDRAAEVGVGEVLITTGEMPDLDPRFSRILSDRGFSSFVDYVITVCEMALDRKLLPHTNIGSVSGELLEMLKPVNASMGLMLETLSTRLARFGPHSSSPGKHPRERIRTISQAGELRIPFTTGILIGIGEDWNERLYSLLAIRYLRRRYDHIQEIIVQNFKPKRGTRMEGYPEPSFRDMLGAVALARVLMPEANIQIPPNLVGDKLRMLLTYGANDIGGISPLTPDYVNPENPWPSLDSLREMLPGFRLLERPPVYPEFIEREGFLEDRIRRIVIEKYGSRGLIDHA